MQTDDEIYNYINKTYQESSLYDLSEALTILSKSISKTSYENKELISSHFSKFVECRSVLEDIFTDVKNKQLNKNLTDEIEKVVKLLNRKYSAIADVTKSDIEQEAFNNRRIYYESEFVEIFTLKPNLTKNLNNFENFVNLYKRAQKIYKPYAKSEFLTKKMKDVEPEIRTFLENVYGYICSETLNFDESCYYFDLYFEIAHDKTDRKIMNTLLVTFKECTYTFDEIDDFDEYFNYLEASLIKFINYVDDDIKKNGIEHYFKCINHAVTNTGTAKVSFRRSKKISEFLNISTTVRQHYMQKMSESKSDVFFKLLKNIEEDEEDTKILAKDDQEDYFESPITSISEKINHDFERSTKIFNSFEEILLENEIFHIQDILIDHIKATIEEQKLSKYDFFKIQITSVRKCLGSRKSMKNKQLDKYLKEKKEATVLELSKEFEEMVEKGLVKENKKVNREDKTIQIFMHILHLLDKTSKESLKDILFEAKEAIVKSKVLFYFLHKFIKLREPEIEGKEATLAKKLQQQFNFLKQGL